MRNRPLPDCCGFHALPSIWLGERASVAGMGLRASSGMGDAKPTGGEEAAAVIASDCGLCRVAPPRSDVAGPSASATSLGLCTANRRRTSTSEFWGSAAKAASMASSKAPGVADGTPLAAATFSASSEGLPALFEVTIGSKVSGPLVVLDCVLAASGQPPLKSPNPAGTGLLTNALADGAGNAPKASRGGNSPKAPSPSSKDFFLWLFFAEREDALCPGDASR
mmetsp:Transcript_21924/g.51252  ORF Transcript_21924/g.51252 Transcript_21924/m.51252 type:complete len:223 (+) Transcript_21924:356-1024(+)